MPDTINGHVLGQTVTMHIGDKVGILLTGGEDTFAGTEGEIVAIHDDSLIDVRTYNGIILTRGRWEVVPALPKKRGGRKPVKRADGEQIVRISTTLPESDVAFLLTINPKNVSAAIRQLIKQSR